MTQTDLSIMDEIVEELELHDVVINGAIDAHTLQQRLLEFIQTNEGVSRQRALDYIITLRRVYVREAAEYEQMEKEATAAKKRNEALAEKIDSALLVYLETNNISTVTTPSGSVTVHDAGGKAPLIIDEGMTPEESPDAWVTTKTTTSFNRAKIMEALKLGTFKHDWARIGERARILKYS